MKKHYKKLIAFIVIFCTILSITPPSFAKVKRPFTIHQKKTTERIASGAVYENIKTLHADGWWNINVVRVDLEDEYTEVSGLFNKNGLSKRQTVSKMVEDSGAVAGINGDYFEYKPYAHPLGAFISEGEMISSPMHIAYGLPAFILDKNNNPKIQFFDRTMNAVSSSTKSPIYIASVNKSSPNYQQVILYNKHWGPKSIGNNIHKDLIEIVVVNDVVTDVRIGKPAVNIPQNGYILTGRGRVRNTLLNNFKVGDTIELKMDSKPDFDQIKFAIGSGSIILQNGKPTNTNIKSPGNHPRTGIGISKDGKELLLVTIDGRDAKFKGVSHEVFGSILKDLGAHNGVALDGGGSTTMAIHPMGNKKAKVVNKPSDGSQRKVVNGVGVFTKEAPKGELSYIKVVTDDTKMFANTSRRFSIKGFDKYHNPVEIDQSKAIYSVEGIEGEIKGNTFKAKTPGKAKVTANYEQFTNTIDIKVLNDVKDITTDLNKFNIDINSKKELNNFYGTDGNGIKALIYPEDLKWTVKGDIGRIENGVFYSYSGEKTGSGALTAQFGEGLENILVSIGSSEVVLESFENIEGFNFSSYPQFVKGNIELANVAKEGNSSLKLSYDFSEGDVTRAAYANFNPDGKNALSIEGKPQKLGLWAYGDGGGSWLRGTIIDNNGKAYNINFAHKIDWTDWKYVTADIPSNVAYPIKLQRLYVVEINGEKKNSGEIYIDKLTAHYPTVYNNVKVPTPSKPKDSKNIVEEKQKNGFSFAVTYIPNNLSQNNTLKAKQQLNKHEVALFMGGTPKGFKNGLNTKMNIDVIKGYKPYRYGNVLFAKADASKNGLRATNPQQWIWLKHDLTYSKEKNIVVILQKPVFGKNGFSDTLEAEMLHEVLLEAKENGKDIWVVHGGYSTKTSLKDGIRYIQINTNPNNNLNIGEFVVNDGNITYQIKSLLN